MRKLLAEFTPKQKFPFFIKIPFISDKQCAEIKRLAKRVKLNAYFRLIFITAKPLAWKFRPSPFNLKCPVNCVACSTAKIKNCCFTKGAIYCIKCTQCELQYIGQTDRCIRTRILEHLKDNKSAVYQHLCTHNSSNANSIEWNILQVSSTLKTRLALEALYINTNSNNLMNGCVGQKLLDFLK